MFSKCQTCTMDADLKGRPWKPVNPSYAKAFGTHSFYEAGGVEPTPPPPPHDLETVDSTNFNFGMPSGLSMRVKKDR